MQRTDDKVKGRGFIQKSVCTLEILWCLTELHTQLNLDFSAQRFPSSRMLLHSFLPGMLRHLLAQPVHNIHMIGQADLVQAGVYSGGSHFRHGVVAIVAAGGVGVVIRKVHAASPFLQRHFLQRMPRDAVFPGPAAARRCFLNFSVH